MTLGLAFWIVMLLLIVAGWWSVAPNWRLGAPYLPILILFILLGWKVFGPAIHG